MADHPTTGEFETEADALKHGTGLPALWLKHVERAQKDEEDWRKAAEQAVEVYEAAAEKPGDAPAFNIVHANIETTVPALYNSSPIPDVRRRYGDADQIGKVAVDVIERGLSYLIDEYAFDDTILEVVRDAELGGRGFARLRYEPELTDTGEVGRQKLACEHVVWNKWCHGPARTWVRVPWIAFEHEFTRADLDRIGVPRRRIEALTFNDSGASRDDAQRNEDTAAGIWKTVKGYEVWDKERRAVHFIAKQDKKEFLATKPDPYQIEAFFPGLPLQPLRKRRDLTPICPYEVYQPLVAELESVTRRIKSLIAQCRVRGLVDKRLGADLELLRLCEDGQYVPADDATAFAQGGGGLERAIAHWPLQEIIVVLKELYVQREQVKQTIYEVTGLSDVLRGSTDPRETLGAQQLKAQSGSQRLSQRQGKVARFVRDLLRMKAEMLCNHFTVENLSAMVGMQIPPEVEQLLRNDLLRSYRIDIESDSTIRADVGRLQEQMTRFLEGTAQYAQAMAPVLQLSPGATPALVEIYAAFSRHFKLGKSAEDALDKLVLAAQQPQEPKPDPEQVKAQLEQQRMQAEMQADQQKLQAQMQADAEKGQREVAKLQATMQMEQQKMQAELAHKRELAMIDREAKLLDLEIAREKAQLEMQAKHMDLEAKQQANVIDLEARREKATADSAAREEKAAFDAKQREAQAKAKQGEAG